MASEFNKYVAIPETNFKVENPEEFIKKIAQNFEGYEIDWLDGLTVKTDNFWLNLRLSNTEPLVRLNIEAKDELVLERVKNDFLALMEKIKK
ncbi:MAG: Phosphomannomutase [Candidatus Azambacteria bacterium GW2011_GWB1_42_17]|uniref:Phosphomannomutase n=1 Tax=Candidatus Azambacteria bacterium GW2011_GWB1_42_17 TaxID=1618615 RepID=A0A0G1BDR4_9BACT|nr:MAG: Phosphomannomutase [Candidatus Azambacteria bacterium GW2011_GWB1_42_17]